MSLDSLALLTIVLMALVTFATRASGFMLVRVAPPGPRLERFLNAAPKTMFVALVTPALVTGGTAEWVGAAVALALMATTRNLLASISAATLAVALVRAL